MRATDGRRDVALPILSVALGYWVAGKLGLLLAIPPGYATAVWPASGLALGAVLLGGFRVWPGVLLGSFLVNVGISFDSSSAATVLRSLSIATSIAAGASLEALAGGYLIRRFVGYPKLLLQDVSTLRVLVLGGPVACVVNAFVAVSTLWAAGLIPTPNYLFTWWTWWVGDSIGVLIFTPLVLVWGRRPWHVWLRQQIRLTLTLTLMFSLVVLLFFFVAHREDARIQADFDKRSDAMVVKLQERLDDYMSVFDALEAFYASSHDVERDEFRSFATALLRTRSGIQALAWEPVVDHAQRAGFEAAVRADGVAGFAIREIAADSTLTEAAVRQRYVPITYIEPQAENSKALGFDLASDPKRSAALALAGRTGEPAATSYVRLIQDPDALHGMLVLAPIFQGPRSAATPPVGYVSAVFVVDRMLRAALASAEQPGIGAWLSDPEEGVDILYQAGMTSAPVASGDDLYRSAEVHLANRRWLINFHLPAAYVVAHHTWEAWSLLAAGMLFTGLLGILMLVIEGRAARVEMLVTQRTAELEHANESLRQEIAERQRLQQEAARQAQELQVSNRDLEQFAYAASHDLQAPLRGVAGFAQLLQSGYQDRLDNDGRDFIGFIVQGCAHMQAIIRDLLTLSRVSTHETAMDEVQMSEVVQQVLRTLKPEIDGAQAIVSVSALPVVDGDRTLLTQLLQNLLGNAIKFRRRDMPPRVDISAEREARFWRFTVRDNGIGISPEHRDRIFAMFARLHTADEYAGTGIGLAICKRIVERHGGRIWVEALPGSGSVFHFTLPAES